MRGMPKISDAERLFYWQIKSIRLELPTQQYKFCATKKWSADFAWVKRRIIVEVEGGIWVNGRHVRPLGFIADCWKYNWATQHGWQLFRFPSDWVKSGDALNLIEEILKQ